ncbi:hypothetical protein [Lentzea aerocolonigenes]|uniref:hypothetical protein n=1 Tax=Lentzea aerocolonigenes TaxID=68170 RepID=UPI000A85621D|nr:hypothetical protein [Lentzea aerocolonigenes]MCP2243597.1 hypothetical protein [Lentzea aerocolonigenes]
MTHHLRKWSRLSMLLRLERRRRAVSSTSETTIDERRQANVVVRPSRGCVAVEGASFGPVYLSPLQVGRMRAALRDAASQLADQGSRLCTAADPFARRS